MIKTIVALVDFSEITNGVIDFSAEQAKAFGAKLYLLHVNPESAEKLYRKIDDDERHRRAEQLKIKYSELHDKAEELRSLGIEVLPRLLEGPEEKTIIQQINKLEAGMLVLGNHRRSDMYRFFVGSIGESIIKEITSPVVLIPK